MNNNEMTDNEEIQYQLTIGHLAMFDVPMSAVENIDLKNQGTQRAILGCLTKDQMIDVLAVNGGEEAKNGN
jgi:BarA-like signal transduction histidine kinase